VLMLEFRVTHRTLELRLLAAFESFVALQGDDSSVLPPAGVTRKCLAAGTLLADC